MISKLKHLKDHLKHAGLKSDASKVAFFVKICSMPGVDSPGEEVEVEGVDMAISHIIENPGLFIFLDNPSGTKKRFGQKNYKKMPFHYGEITEMNNPSDDMGWDVIVVPSGSDTAITSKGETPHVPIGHNLIPVGYVPVNESVEDWKRNTKTKKNPGGKPPPVGNDKIILAPDGVFSDIDIEEVESFFAPMWNFKNVIWL